MSAAVYAGLKQGHAVKEVRAGGACVLLDDDSLWQVYEGFVFRSQAWQCDEMITVKTNKNAQYPYKLINIHRNESVEVALLQS